MIVCLNTKSWEFNKQINMFVVKRVVLYLFTGVFASDKPDETDLFCRWWHHMFVLAQPLGAICGSVSCPRWLRHAVWRSDLLYLQSHSRPKWLGSTYWGLKQSMRRVHFVTYQWVTVDTLTSHILITFSHIQYVLSMKTEQDLMNCQQVESEFIVSYIIEMFKNRIINKFYRLMIGLGSDENAIEVTKSIFFLCM